MHSQSGHEGQPTEEAKRAFARKRQGGGGGDIERGFREAMEARRAITAALAAEGVAAILTDSGKPHGLLNMSGFVAWHRSSGSGRAHSYSLHGSRTL